MRLRFIVRALAIVAALVTCAVRCGCALAARWQSRGEREAALGRALLSLCRRLGATFIKAGQLLSTRPDLVPVGVARALEDLQDDVGPFAFVSVMRTLGQSLGRPLGDVFAEIAPSPLASAAIAQVHKARLHDGRLVAVKVRRPEVARTMAFDLAVLRPFVRLLAWVPGWRRLDPVDAFDELARALGAQVDLRHEAEHSRRFRRAFAGDTEILFPHVIDALSSESVLVMEFVDGVRLRDIGRTRVDPGRVARTGLRALLEMIFTHGFVHADLHPGNVLVTPQGRVALLDVGLVGSLTPASRHTLARLFGAWAMRDGDAMAGLLYRLSAAPGTGDASDATFQSLRASVIELVGHTWGKPLGELAVGPVLLDLLTLVRRHRIRLDPAVTIVCVAIAVVEGVGKRLDPGLDLMAEALPWLIAHPVPADASASV